MSTSSSQRSATVAEGGSVIDPKVVDALVAENARSEDSPLNELTPRERDVLREMAEGKNNAAIAEIALPDREIGREGDPLDLPQARADVGDGGSQAGQGRDPLPRRERLASARVGSEPAIRVPPPDTAVIVSRPPSASTRSRIAARCASAGSTPASSATISNATVPFSSRMPIAAVVPVPRRSNAATMQK